MRAKFKSRYALVAQISIVLIVLCACEHYRSTNMFPSGEEWMHWNEAEREQYIRAYVEGNTQGFAAGCEQADSLIISPNNVQGFIDANNRCEAQMPFTSGKDVMKLIASVTAFFDRYTEHRELRVSQVLHKLDAGRTIEQVHEDFSPKQ